MAPITPTSAVAPSWQQEVVSFVMKRKKVSGGFSATPRLPATIQDTYHALRILTTLGRHNFAPSPHDDGPLLEYLTRARQSEQHSAKVAFQRLASCQLAGAESECDAIVGFVHRRLQETTELEERYYCRRMIAEIARQDGPEFCLMPAPATPWSFRTASDLWMLLSLSQEQSERAKGLAEWLRACQTYDGGFGFLPGTTSFMENGYDALRALQMLGSAPMQRQGCRAFIMACRTRTGGFARKGGATAFLSSTWHAVASLELLNQE